MEYEDISILDLVRRWDSQMIVNFKDNRDPEKTWNDQKRSLFVGDLFSGSATKPYIILWKDISASYDCADNVMDAMNRFHAIVKVSNGTIPIIIGHANGKAYWMPPQGMDVHSSKSSSCVHNTAQPSSGTFKCFLSPGQIKAFYDHTKVVLLTWKNCDFKMANEMARNLNRATKMTAGQELRFVLNGESALSKLASELSEGQFKWMSNPFFKETGHDEVMKWLAMFVFKMTNAKDNVKGTWNNTAPASQLESYFNKNTELSEHARQATMTMVEHVSALVSKTLPIASAEACGAKKRHMGYLNSLAACVLIQLEINKFPTASMWESAWNFEYDDANVSSRGTVVHFKYNLNRLIKGAKPQKRPNKRARNGECSE